MAKIIVVTGLDQLPPGERWPRLVAPLADELAGSGLGEVVDLPGLRREAGSGGGLAATEVAVRLVHFDYGRDLVDRVVEAAGVKRHRPVVPARWRAFNCGDYFASALAGRGYRDEWGEFWYVEPAERVYEDSEQPFLVIGGPGVDGIHWGYRRGLSGIWAYPIDGEFVWLAPSAGELLEGWLSGAVTI